MNSVHQKMPLILSPSQRQDIIVKSETGFKKKRPIIVDMSESLELVENRCHQDILKQIRDRRSPKVPLSYSKSIAYLGNPLTESLLKISTSSTTTNIFPSPYFAQSSTHREEIPPSSDIRLRYHRQIAVTLRNRQKEGSPVDLRVQSMLLKSDSSKNPKYMIPLTQLSPHLPPSTLIGADQDTMNAQHINVSTLYLDDKSQQQQVNNLQPQEQQLSTNPPQQNEQPVNIQEQIQQPLPTQTLKPYFSQRYNKSMVAVSEKFPLKKNNSSNIENITMTDQKNSLMRIRHFKPLKIMPPLVKMAYSDKPKLYEMGLLSTSSNVHEFPLIPMSTSVKLGKQHQSTQSISFKNNNHNDVLHSNDLLRHECQGSKLKPTATTGSPLKSHRQNASQLLNTFCNNFNIKGITNELQNASNIEGSGDEVNEVDFNDTSLAVKSARYGQDEERKRKNGSDTSYVDDAILNEGKSSTQLGKHSSNLNSSRLQITYNHFHRANLLKNDEEYQRYQHIKCELSGSLRGFKSQPPKHAEIIVQNQLPGSKIILKKPKNIVDEQVEQRNSADSKSPKKKEVYHTLPDRSNFFKSKKSDISLLLKSTISMVK